MSTYTVAAAAGQTQTPIPTPVLVPNKLQWNGSAWVAAPGSHLVTLLLKPGVVLNADLGAYVAAQHPSLITVV